MGVRTAPDANFFDGFSIFRGLCLNYNVTPLALPDPKQEKFRRAEVLTASSGKRGLAAPCLFFFVIFRRRGEDRRFVH